MEVKKNFIFNKEIALSFKADVWERILKEIKRKKTLKTKRKKHLHY